MPDEVVHEALRTCQQRNFKMLESFAGQVVSNGFPVTQVLSQLVDVITNDESITNVKKARICMAIGEAERKQGMVGAGPHAQRKEVPHE